MARIGIISDTHGSLPDAAFHLFNGDWTEDELANSIITAANVACASDGTITFEPMPSAELKPTKANLIIHGGDIGPQMVLDELGAIARTIAVLGNNDHERFWCSDGEVRDYRSLTFDDVDIFVQHIPREMEASLKGRPPLQPALVKTQPVLAIHGHTHIPRLETNGRRITLCPGSPTRGRNGSGHAAALVDTEGGSIIRAALIRLP